MTSFITGLSWALGKHGKRAGGGGGDDSEYSYRDKKKDEDEEGKEM